MSRARVLGAGVLLAGGVCALAYLRCGPAPLTDENAETPRAPAARGTELTTLESAPRAAAESNAGATAEEEPLTPDELELLLRAVAAAYATNDRPALENALERVLGTRAGGLRVVAWLREARAETQALAGALVALEAALALDASTDPAHADTGDASALVQALLDALPELELDVRTRVIAVLRSAHGPHGAVFGVACLRALLALQHAHPELAGQLGPLFERAGEGLAGDDARADFRRLFLTGSDDPALVKLALGSLLAAEPATFLPLAEELYVRAKSQPELRAAIAQAIAASAPVADAAAILARCAGDNPYAQIQTLASRTGAPDAIAREYDALLASGANTRGRQMLVSGMRGETEGVLLGIARLDPEPGVRVQALLTLTIRGPASEDVVRELTSLHASGELAGGIATKSAVLVAENVLLRSIGGARDAAREFLGSIVRDSAAAPADRFDAYKRLRAWVPAGTFRGVVVDGQVLE